MNNYCLTEEIGRGKYSIVYKARKKKTIQYFAVKSVEKQYRDKVLNEVSMNQRSLLISLIGSYYAPTGS
jgi:serine/threonine-protein kinase ULK4